MTFSLHAKADWSLAGELVWIEVNLIRKKCRILTDVTFQNSGLYVLIGWIVDVKICKGAINTEHFGAKIGSRIG